jgi:hypothetical protein
MIARSSTPGSEAALFDRKPRTISYREISDRRLSGVSAFILTGERDGDWPVGLCRRPTAQLATGLFPRQIVQSSQTVSMLVFSSLGQLMVGRPAAMAAPCCPSVMCCFRRCGPVPRGSADPRLCRSATWRGLFVWLAVWPRCILRRTCRPVLGSSAFSLVASGADEEVAAEDDDGMGACCA